jgi:hypothetical protein
LKTRRLTVQAAVFEHAWPCADLLPQWQAHPNGAIEVLGLALAAEPPGQSGLDTTGFRYLSAASLEGTYGAERGVRLKVDDLSRAREALSRGGVAWREAEAGLIVPRHGPFACAFEFAA